MKRSTGIAADQKGGAWIHSDPGSGEPHRGSGEETAGRYLIVNADDFGMSTAVNQGVLEAHDQGIVTSASLLVLWPAAAAAAASAACRPRLDLGLHVDLGEWRWENGGWQTVYRRAPLEDAGAVAAEIERQIGLFRRLVGRDPTHLDSHQHVHLDEPARSLIVQGAREIGIPLRGCTPGIRYCGGFYGQTSTGGSLPGAIGVPALLGILDGLSTGVTELGCHPGAGDGPDSSYGAERILETRTLCDLHVRAAIDTEGITLCRFTDWRFNR